MFSEDVFCKGYEIPATIDEAVGLLREKQGRAIIIGGGTDLIPQFRSRSRLTEYLVDVTRIASMKTIEFSSGEIVIGGAVTHAEAVASPIVKQYARALALGCEAVGSPQIRQIATLSGNIVNAQPAADSAVPLIALDAQVHIIGVNGRRATPVAETFLGVGQSSIDSSCELIEKITISPLEALQGEASDFQRLACRKALSLPMVNAAVSLKLVGGRLDWIRIATAPMARYPLRLYEL